MLGKSYKSKYIIIFTINKIKNISPNLSLCDYTFNSKYYKHTCKCIHLTKVHSTGCDI